MAGMTKMVSIAAQVDDGVAGRLDRLAARSGRAAGEIAGDILRQYVEEQEAFWRDLDEADAAVARGDYVTHEEMIAELRAIVAGRPAD
ncbi:Predicted transcriptional regulator [Sphingomonas jatrophae]|uniref:Predicted transcriptional regulator n=2 Tax=Sphingomonas jatrophae TaxID=1166337 RepID=A0A1I6KXZ1_9SPHN|nr:Predicted transcriptional regulator [Sphingomonas jatrophae]